MFKDQLTLLGSGDVSRWDLSLLCKCLSSFTFDNPLPSTLVDKQMIEVVREVRNLCSHRQKKSELSTQDYTPLLEMMTKVLLHFGLSQQDIDCLVSLKDLTLPHDQVDNVKNTERSQELKKLANKEYEAKRYEKAVDLYARALDFQGLSNLDMSILYGNRAQCYIQLYQLSKANKSYIVNAKIDAMMAQKLRPSWVKSYIRLGTIYKLNQKYQKAVMRFDLAIAMEPSNKEAKDGKSECNLWLGRQERKEVFDPAYTPGPVEETYAKVAKDIGKVSVQEIIRKAECFTKKEIEWNQICHMGHCSLRGRSDTRVDPVKAAGYFRKAADDGCPEGMFNLALQYQDGIGVPRDLTKSHELFLQAASMPPLMADGKSRTIGVAEAMHNIGLHFDNGVVVDKNPMFAFTWYEKAAKYDLPNSLNNMGLMLYNGENGIPQDMTRGLELIERSATLGDHNAMINYADFNLSAKGLKFLEQAAKQGSIPALNRIPKYKEALKNAPKGPDPFSKIREIINAPKPTPMERSTRVYDYVELSKISMEKGDKTMATLLARALECRNEFVYNLMVSKTMDLRIFARGIELADYAQQLPTEIRMLVYEHAKKMLGMNVDDRSARVCYGHLCQDLELNIQFNLQSIQLFPKDRYFRNHLCKLYGFLQRFDKLLQGINELLIEDPKDYDYLYSKAVGCRMTQQRPQDVIKAYQLYISNAPIDERKIPEAYYAISGQYIMMGPEHISKAQSSFQQGEDSEKHQLSCFIPIDSRSKKLAEMGLYPERYVDVPIPKVLPTPNK
eukprot:gene6265-7270_t